MPPITAEMVRQLIETFFELNASRAPLTDFLPILDHEGFSMELVGTDIRFVGMAGLGDHQIGKLIFFDQEFHLQNIQVDLAGDNATAGPRPNGMRPPGPVPIPTATASRLRFATPGTWGVPKTIPGPYCWDKCARSSTISRLRPQRSGQGFL